MDLHPAIEVLILMTPGLMLLQYLMWFSFVRDKSFEHRWEFWVGLIPFGMFVVWFTWTWPYIVEWFEDIIDSIRYYLKGTFK